jgi:hypothetical protein
MAWGESMLGYNINGGAATRNSTIDFYFAFFTPFAYLEPILKHRAAPTTPLMHQYRRHHHFTTLTQSTSSRKYQKYTRFFSLLKTFFLVLLTNALPPPKRRFFVQTKKGDR